MGDSFDTSSAALPGPMAWRFQQLAQLRIPKLSLALALVMICTVGIFSRCFYNLYLHPLGKIPGPKLAAMTSLPDFYYDIVKDGSYLFDIQKMHENYGPIVRITPNEVHINDPDFFSAVYSSGKSKVNKDPSTVAAFGQPDALVATVDHDQHRTRRGYLSRHYSKRAVDALIPLITERIDALCARFEGALNTGSRISLDRAFSALAADVIYAQFFGTHLDYLSDPDLRVLWRDAFIGLSAGFHSSRLIPDLARMLKKLPPNFSKLVLRLLNGPLIDALLDLQEHIKQTVERLLADNNPGSPAAQCVIVEVLRNPDIPPQDRTIERLVDDGMIFGFAGTETSSRALAVGSFYLLNDKPILAKLRTELAAATEKSPNQTLTLGELEKLPYLTGVVKESIRLAFGPVCRLPRIHTEEALFYHGHIIPAGCPISMSTWFLNLHPKPFPDPWNFKPERWIEAAQNGFPLTNYLGSFSRGTRGCLGQNLAYAELYMALSRVHCQFEMELVDTTAKDVAVEMAHMVGYPRLTSGRTDGEAEVKVKVTHRLNA
ncbi:hypothetical protein INS49_000257 [Diaporthe citri]|uniref:uncharacterized protein n=1 Tax=Diaporthe citri TaxID=83186 RepID=UPI001C7FA0C3|nr:uncharacterized protein INS49_000257 [Diaporthe citri]KAG6366081.1 hypothetical protein INS49_000257 [Diaporthe citri]